MALYRSSYAWITQLLHIRYYTLLSLDLYSRLSIHGCCWLDQQWQWWSHTYLCPHSPWAPLFNQGTCKNDFISMVVALWWHCTVPLTLGLPNYWVPDTILYCSTQPAKAYRSNSYPPSDHSLLMSVSHQHSDCSLIHCQLLLASLGKGACIASSY
jgi:hypothetical protein